MGKVLRILCPKKKLKHSEFQGLTIKQLNCPKAHWSPPTDNKVTDSDWTKAMLNCLKYYFSVNSQRVHEESQLRVKHSSG
jgi:hypothetical protein